MSLAAAKIHPPSTKVLITGGNGFLGKALTETLTRQNLSVLVYARTAEKQDSQYENGKDSVSFVCGDIADKKALANAAQGVSIIIHLAAAMQGDWDTHQRTTIAGTRNVLETCREQAINKLIYVSTLNVYDASQYDKNLTVEENFDYEPHPEKRGFYSAAKLAAEQLITDFSEQHPDVDITLFRPGLIYGPGLSPLLKDLGKIVANRYILCPGNGQRKLPLIYSKDVADAILKVIGQKRKGLHRYNLVAPDSPSQKQYLSLYNELAKTNYKLIPLPLILLKTGFCLLDMVFKFVVRKPKHLSYRLASISNSPSFSIAKAQSELQWEAKTPLKTAMQNMLLWQNEYFKKEN